jgi:beta-RFAP synthase
MQDSASVAVSARLHLGFLDLHGGLGRRFGGLGLALDEPKTVLVITRSGSDSAAGPQADRAFGYLRVLAEALGLPSGHRLTVLRAIPAHAGLGSGTQLALAVAAALRRVHGLILDIKGDAVRLDRAARSGLGAGFFEHGGLALDGGRAENGAPAPIIARLPFPEAWRVLLVLDPARQGAYGTDEVRALAALPRFPAELAAHLCRLVVMQALPAVAEADLAGFGTAITEIQRHVGDHFSAVQGGRFMSPAVAAVIDLLAANGIEGYGQSSWGPTGFAFCRSEDEAKSMRELSLPLASRSGLRLEVVKGRNEGAAMDRPRLCAGQGGSRA